MYVIIVMYNIEPVSYFTGDALTLYRKSKVNACDVHITVHSDEEVLA